MPVLRDCLSIGETEDEKQLKMEQACRDLHSSPLGRGFNSRHLHQKLQAAVLAAFIFGGTKSQDFSSRGISRSSLKTGGFLHIFTKVLLVKTLHCIPLVKSLASLSCEVAPFGSKDGVVFIF